MECGGKAKRRPRFGFELWTAIYFASCFEPKRRRRYALPAHSIAPGARAPTRNTFVVVVSGCARLALKFLFELENLTIEVFDHGQIVLEGDLAQWMVLGFGADRNVMLVRLDAFEKEVEVVVFDIGVDELLPWRSMTQTYI